MLRCEVRKRLRNSAFGTINISGYFHFLDSSMIGKHWEGAQQKFQVFPKVSSVMQMQTSLACNEKQTFFHIILFNIIFKYFFPLYDTSFSARKSYGTLLGPPII